MGYTNPNHPSVSPATRRDLLAHAWIQTAMRGPEAMSFEEAVRRAYAAADAAIEALDAAKS